jgi:hypothetical protein
MPINEQTDLVLRQYVRKNFPTIESNVNTYIADELQRIENAINSLSEASIQATDQAPSNPRKGTVRFNVLPWDALGDSSQGMVVYNGSAWVAV